MANVLQDYFNRQRALNQQRGMTGNMQYGRSLDPAIAEGYFDSYQKNKLQSQTIANQKEGLDIQRFGAQTQRMGVEADIGYKDWSKGFQEKGLAAQIDYNNRMLGFKGEELAMQNAWNMARIGIESKNQAAQEKYGIESLDIQRQNAAANAAYQQGSLANQRAQIDAQSDQARASLITGGITGAMTFGGTALGIWDKHRQWTAEMRAKGRNPDGSPRTPEQESNEAYEPDWGGFTGSVDVGAYPGQYNWQPTYNAYPAMDFSPQAWQPPAYDTSGYTGMGSMNFNPSANIQPWSYSNPNYFINDIFFNVPDIPSYVDPSYGYSYDPSIY
jgi:hypothetical protein